MAARDKAAHAVKHASRFKHSKLSLDFSEKGGKVGLSVGELALPTTSTGPVDDERYPDDTRDHTVPWRHTDEQGCAQSANSKMSESKVAEQTSLLLKMAMMNTCVDKKTKKTGRNDQESYNSKAGRPKPSSRLRLQDADLQLLRDEGKVLSMHQPYASLLVAGIKQVEGRSWYTKHRGILWIASTVKSASIAEIKRVHDFYLRYHNVDRLPFPSLYPTGLVLGCVEITDCIENDPTLTGAEVDSPYLWICKHPRRIDIDLPIMGQHRIYTMDEEMHRIAERNVRRVLALFGQEKVEPEAARTQPSNLSSVPFEEHVPACNGYEERDDDSEPN